MAISRTENRKYQNLVWTNTVFEYETPQSSAKVSNSAASQLTAVYTYIYIPNTSAVNKTVNYPGDLAQGRATDDKSDCSNGISIRGRLYVYSMYTLWGLLDVLSSYRPVHEQPVRGGWKGLGSDEYIRLKLIGIVPWLISRSWWFVAASDRQ